MGSRRPETNNSQHLQCLPWARRCSKENFAAGNYNYDEDNIIFYYNYSLLLITATTTMKKGIIIPTIQMEKTQAQRC